MTEGDTSDPHLETFKESQGEDKAVAATCPAWVSGETALCKLTDTHDKDSNFSIACHHHTANPIASALPSAVWPGRHRQPEGSRDRTDQHVA
ncbi:unnamed protein product [Prunus armeniaca]|uniref:Uncharacterized protein n=1 Tax=Prunus armeniaca TaxID=36596 RepID=A0A6J5VE68_PRUAR|nr:unnamed protein product [Prunus armeniaca]